MGFLGWCTEVAFAACKERKICKQRISKRSDLSDIWNRCRDCCSVFDTIQGKSGAAVYCICSDGDCFWNG